MPKRGARFREFPLFQEIGEFAGWRGLNLSRDETFLAPYEATASMNLTNRTGLKTANIGGLSTRPGYADGAKYEMPTGNSDTIAQSFPVRMLAKFYADVAIKQDGEIIQFVGDRVQSWDGAAWNNLVTGLENGGGVLDPDGGYYPQWIVMDLPRPRFCWIDPENGLYIYDGTTMEKVEVPKNSASGDDIRGALWLAQVDGRLVVSGNWFDEAENNIIYYSAVGDPSNFASAAGGGSFPVYGATSRGGGSPPKRVTGLAEFSGQLVVFTEDMRYLITGIGTIAQRRRIEPGFGVKMGKQIMSINDALYWWGKDGVYEWTRGLPRNIGRKIWSKHKGIENRDSGQNIVFHQFFAFEFEDQLWFNFKHEDNTGDYLNTNFIYDLQTRDWYESDIPMVAAFNSKGGFDDGGLFFASPKDFDVGGGPQFKKFRFGLDDVEGDGVEIYIDEVSGAAQSRTGTPITTSWSSGKFDTGNILLQKRVEALLLQFRTVNGGGSVTPEFPPGPIRMTYTVDDDGATRFFVFPTASITGQPMHYLPAQVEVDEFGHFIKFSLDITVTNIRIDIRRMYLIVDDMQVAKWEPR